MRSFLQLRVSSKRYAKHDDYFDQDGTGNRQRACSAAARGGRDLKLALANNIDGRFCTKSAPACLGYLHGVPDRRCSDTVSQFNKKHCCG